MSFYVFYVFLKSPLCFCGCCNSDADVRLALGKRYPPKSPIELSGLAVQRGEIVTSFGLAGGVGMGVWRAFGDGWMDGYPL